jgi:hypothetical protein
MSLVGRIAREPPIRLLVQWILRGLPVSAATRARWELVPRPHYMMGLVAAARRAQKEKVPEIAAIEFGVAGGNGLLELERYARIVERSFPVRIRVVGFDTGEGLPSACNDYRDHPDLWVAGDYPMNFPALRRRLDQGTELILGDVAKTVQDWVSERQSGPLGFAAFDLDLYSSTREALVVLAHDKRRTLRRTFLYFDDVLGSHYHQFAGELLAIREFNDSQVDVRIDRWRGLGTELVFPESGWVQKMYVAHDLLAISRFQMSRGPECGRLRLRS